MASKTDTRYVKGRHRAGGSSQKRFARIREKQARELFDEACGVLQERFSPYAADLEHVFLGGERMTLLAFRSRCRYLAGLSDRIRQRVLSVREPSHQALEQIPQEVWKSRLYRLG